MRGSEIVGERESVSEREQGRGRRPPAVQARSPRLALPQPIPRLSHANRAHRFETAQQTRPLPNLLSSRQAQTDSKQRLQRSPRQQPAAQHWPSAPWIRRRPTPSFARRTGRPSIQTAQSSRCRWLTAPSPLRRQQIVSSACRRHRQQSSHQYVTFETGSLDWLQRLQQVQYWPQLGVGGSSWAPAAAVLGRGYGDRRCGIHTAA